MKKLFILSLSALTLFSCGGSTQNQNSPAEKTEAKTPGNPTQSQNDDDDQGCDRSFVRDNIKKFGECKNVAITKSNGDLMLYGRNGYAVNECCPSDLTETIKKLNSNNELIDDVQLTENGAWLVIYGDNGIIWNNIPSSLENKIKEYNSNGEVINSITFNDSGDWIIITDERYCTSDADATDWLSNGEKQYGELWAACLTDDGMVAVYEKGYQFTGNVPSNLKSALQKTSINVYRLKIAGTAWFFADSDGNYEYDM